MTDTTPTPVGANSFSRDVWFIYRRQMRRQLRVPVWVVIGVIQPVLYLTLFGPLINTLVTSSPGFPGGNSWAFFVPGLLVQLGLFGTSFVGFGIIDELRSGILERMRVSPMNRLALLVGRVLRDVTVLFVQGAILVTMGLLFGLDAPLAGVVAGFVIIGLLGMGLASFSYAAGLTFKDEGALAAIINFITVPLMLLSGILLPMTLAPGWLHDLSRLNPLLYVVDAVRACYAGDWHDPHLAIGFASVVAVLLVAMVVGVRTFRSEA